MTEVVVDRTGVVPVVGELEAAGMTQCVGVHRKPRFAWAPARAMSFLTEEPVIVPRRSVVKT